MDMYREGQGPSAQNIGRHFFILGERGRRVPAKATVSINLIICTQDVTSRSIYDVAYALQT